jgi:hypothetical protein
VFNVNRFLRSGEFNKGKSLRHPKMAHGPAKPRTEFYLCSRISKPAILPLYVEVEEQTVSEETGFQAIQLKHSIPVSIIQLIQTRQKQPQQPTQLLRYRQLKDGSC